VPFIGEPFKALLTDVVTPEYAFTLMNTMKCGSPADKAYPVFTAGAGAKRALIITGFSINDYKISNALLYMLLNKCVNDVYSIPTFSTSQLSKWTINIVPMANPWPYNSWEVIRGKVQFYDLDDEGIPVRYDALTLKSKYSVRLHGLVNDMKPDLIMVLMSSSKWSIMTTEPIRINDYETSIPDPTDFAQHFSYEGYPTLIVSIPNETSIREIIHEVIQLIRDYNVKKQESKFLELIVKVNGDINTILNVLRSHDLSVNVDGNKLIIRPSDKSRYLLNSLIDNNLIENYLNVEILEIHPQ
jgi:hypothetical protein